MSNCKVSFFISSHFITLIVLSLHIDKLENKNKSATRSLGRIISTRHIALAASTAPGT